MTRRTFAVVAIGALFGCSEGPSESTVPLLPPGAFEGAWRSVTPSLEFIRLSVNSKSSEQGALGARLTFSGVAWDGGGHVDGDSLVVSMTIPGTSTTGGVLVAHARDEGTLQVQFRSGTVPPPLELTLVREK
jgi:hypothetical protein